MTDLINHPPHYSDHNGSGVQCIDITEHMPFTTGNAVKYLWRAGRKGETTADLNKALWYIDRELKRIPISFDRISVPTAGRNAFTAWNAAADGNNPTTRIIRLLFIAAANYGVDRLRLVNAARALLAAHIADTA